MFVHSLVRDTFKKPPKSPAEAPSTHEENIRRCQRNPQDAPKTPIRKRWMPQEEAKATPRRPKMSLRRAQDAPRTPREARRSPPETPRSRKRPQGPQETRRCPQEATKSQICGARGPTQCVYRSQQPRIGGAGREASTIFEKRLSASRMTWRGPGPSSGHLGSSSGRLGAVLALLRPSCGRLGAA